MTPESKIKKEIREYLDSLGERCWHAQYTNSGYGKSGVPDRIVCYRGTFIGLEIKPYDKSPTVWQRREIAAVIAAGGIAEVVWSVKQVQEIIEQIDAKLDALLV